MYDEGISKSASVIDAATDIGVLQRSGAWVLHGSAKIAQGREAAKTYLKENPNVLAQIEKETREKAMVSE